jgi:hypothetical protein
VLTKKMSHTSFDAHTKQLTNLGKLLWTPSAPGSQRNKHFPAWPNFSSIN